MIFELAGSRMLAPYLGTSIFVWTSIIGVILGSLSIGYWLGGKLADKKTSFDFLSSIILGAACAIFFVFIVKDLILYLFQLGRFGIEVSSFLSSLFLFAPASILLGIVSPYATRLKITNLENSASTVGNLYAISTVGSIAGTFFAGFFLIPHLGTTNIILLLSATLVITSIVLSRRLAVFQVVVLTAVLGSFWINKYIQQNLENLGIRVIDTEYNQVVLSEDTDKKTKKPALFLLTDPFVTQSAMFLEDSDLVFEYTKFFRLANHFKPDLKKSLMLGGCAYSYPKDYLKKNPEALLDVVEIDPGMTTIAKEYFNLKDNPRLAIYHEDGRTFLNRINEKYDVIFGDTFNSFSIPFQMSTRETASRQYDILNDDGLVILNMISAIEGKSGKFLRAEYATYRSIFPQVYIFPVTEPDDGAKIQNVILIALKSDKQPDFKSEDPELDSYLKNRWTGAIANDVPIITDDFAPVEYYRYQTI